MILETIFQVQIRTTNVYLLHLLVIQSIYQAAEGKNTGIGEDAGGDPKIPFPFSWHSPFTCFTLQPMWLEDRKRTDSMMRDEDSLYPLVRNSFYLAAYG